MRKQAVRFRVTDREPAPHRIPMHPYRAHPNPPALSIARGKIKCRVCGMYTDSPIHIEVVR